MAAPTPMLRVRSLPFALAEALVELAPRPTIRAAWERVAKSGCADAATTQPSALVHALHDATGDAEFASIVSQRAQVLQRVVGAPCLATAAVVVLWCAGCDRKPSPALARTASAITAVFPRGEGDGLGGGGNNSTRASPRGGSGPPSPAGRTMSSPRGGGIISPATGGGGTSVAGGGVIGYDEMHPSGSVHKTSALHRGATYAADHDAHVRGPGLTALLTALATGTPATLPPSTLESLLRCLFDVVPGVDGDGDAAVGWVARIGVATHTSTLAVAVLEDAVRSRLTPAHSGMPSGSGGCGVGLFGDASGGEMGPGSGHPPGVAPLPAPPPPPAPFDADCQVANCKRASLVVVGDGGTSAAVVDCSDTTIHVTGKGLTTLYIAACSRCTIVVPPLAGHVMVDGVDACTIAVAAPAITVRNSFDTVMQVWTRTPTLVVGEWRGVRLAPYAVVARRLRQAALHCALLPGVEGAKRDGDGSRKVVEEEEEAGVVYPPSTLAAAGSVADGRGGGGGEGKEGEGGDMAMGCETVLPIQPLTLLAPPHARAAFAVAPSSSSSSSSTPCQSVAVDATGRNRWFQVAIASITTPPASTTPSTMGAASSPTTQTKPSTSLVDVRGATASGVKQSPTGHQGAPSLVTSGNGAGSALPSLLALPPADLHPLSAPDCDTTWSSHTVPPTTSLTVSPTTTLPLPRDYVDAMVARVAEAERLRDLLADALGAGAASPVASTPPPGPPPPSPPTVNHAMFVTAIHGAFADWLADTGQTHKLFDRTKVGVVGVSPHAGVVVHTAGVGSSGAAAAGGGGPLLSDRSRSGSSSHDSSRRGSDSGFR